MKIIFFALIGFVVASNSFASSEFVCSTKVDERTGYYVKTVVRLKVLSASSIFVQPFDMESRSWADGSTGKLTGKNKNTGMARFSGFRSSDLFGDLSEGAASSINVYLSDEVLSGKSGAMSLFAGGSETGLEKATYACKVKKSALQN